MCEQVAAELSAIGDVHRPAGGPLHRGRVPARWPSEVGRARGPASHILVNNAGATWGAPIDEHDDATWDRVLDLNVKGVFHLTKFLRPLLEAAATDDDPARVINIGSIDGIQVPMLETYSYSRQQGRRAPAHPPPGRAGWRRESRSTRWPRARSSRR